MADIDPRRARDKRLNAWNDLVADRRPEFYSALHGFEPKRGPGA